MEKGIFKKNIKFMILNNIVLFFTMFFTNCISIYEKEHLSTQLVNSLNETNQAQFNKNPEFIILKGIKNNLEQVIGRSETSLNYLYLDISDNENLNNSIERMKKNTYR